MPKSEYYVPSQKCWKRIENFHLLSEEEVVEIVHYWFAQNYIDPVEICPVDRGEYIYIYGGPFRADEVILEEFENIINNDFLEKAYKEIPNREDSFSLIPDRFWSDYTVTNPYLIFKEHIEDIQRLRAVNNRDIELHKKYISLLFVNTITAFETYISDELINLVKDNPTYEKIFLESIKKKYFNRKSNLIEKIYSITFSRPQYLKDYFLSLLNISIPDNNLIELEKLYDIRNDIMHRNGKNVQGEFVISGEMDLDWCLSQIIEMVNTIIDYRS